MTAFQDPPIPPDLRDLPDLQGCRKKIPGLQDLLGPKDLLDQQVPPDLQAHRVPRGPKVQQDRKERRVTQALKVQQEREERMAIRALQVQQERKEQKVTLALQVQPDRRDRKVTKAIRVRRGLPEPQDLRVLQDPPDLQDQR